MQVSAPNPRTTSSGKRAQRDFRAKIHVVSVTILTSPYFEYNLWQAHKRLPRLGPDLSREIAHRMIVEVLEDISTTLELSSSLRPSLSDRFDRLREELERLYLRVGFPSQC